MKTIQASLLSIFIVTASLAAKTQYSIPQRAAIKTIAAKANSVKNRPGKYFQESSSMSVASNKSLRSSRAITPETAYVDGKMNVR